MPLDPGTRLGNYHVTALIGEGGMGQVWQATDTQLKRQVALKILPAAFADDPDRLARFQREAQILASLNHPNIAAIYGIEQSDDTRALVLELVEGPTLADRITQGPIPLDEALPIAKQIAEALEAAHEAGVIHRDLKPANIKVRDDGTVKVLDFGFAKAVDPTPTGDPSQSPTLTAAATQMGMIMGTAAYMSPEQAAGKPVDKRSDIWSFGVVLFEMLTGTRAFVGETVSHVLASVLNAEPDWMTLTRELPSALRRPLRRCLIKDPRSRLRDIGEVRVALEQNLTAPSAVESEATTGEPSTIWLRSAQLLVALLAGATLAGIGVWRVSSTLPTAVTRFTVPLSADHPMLGWSGPTLSPDGRTLLVPACGGGCSLPAADTVAYRRHLDKLDIGLIPGTEGVTYAFFSHDGEWLGVLDSSGLRKVSSQGGPAVPLLQGTFSGASWGADETILLGGPTLLRMSSAGGEPEEIAVAVEGESYYDPKHLPGGKAALVTLWKGDLDTAQVAVVVLDTGELRPIAEGVSPHYVPPGYVVFARDGSLWALGFDASRLEAQGAAIPVLDGVGFVPNQGQAMFSVARDGTLAYFSGELAALHVRASLAWVDREGREEALALAPGNYPSWARVSPDGTRIAVEVSEGDDLDIWVVELPTGRRTKLTDDPASDRYPVWTPDGRRIVFESNRNGGAWELYWKLVDEPDRAQRILEIDPSIYRLRPYGWSADGNTLVFEYGSLENGDIGTAAIDGEGSWEALIESSANEFSPSVAPGGGWIAYVSTATGRPEVYVAEFPGLSQNRPVSVRGGTQPAWSPTSDELFYYRPDDGAMVAVSIVTTPRLSIGDENVLFQTSELLDRGHRTYDVAPDGDAFLMLKPIDDGRQLPEEIVVVQNWTVELERLVPVDK